MFQTTHRLQIPIPHLRRSYTPPQSPHTPSRTQYTPLADRYDSIPRPKRPVAALLSPWSPSEQEYPYDDPHVPLMRYRDSMCDPATPPPLGLPPRVYVPETPLRGDFVISRHEDWDKTGTDPFAAAREHVDPEASVRSLRQRQRELKRELAKEGVFVIGEAEDWDSDSDTESLYSIQTCTK
ncbi:hypothetical protein EIP91_009854 [Steccherinum ochraceum]|uniref:Uncharacterized protein n=1 Tax=Steccherinum ochraceum TaxID=92696 RepID=A0A4R0R159_9APHY|nr:hypothetical protein EIP91_009854 [Steccherinum ochraceum]